MDRIKKIMLTTVPTLKKEAKIEEALKIMANAGTGCVVIVENNKLIGIVTELDFVRNIAQGKSLKEPVSRIMTSPVVSMAPDIKLDEALKIIDTKKFRKYPVVENDTLLGIVTKKDLVIAVSDNVRLHRNIQNIVLILFVLFEFFIFVFSSYFSEYFTFGA